MPDSFGTKVVPQALSGGVLRHLVAFLNRFTGETDATNMSETLVGSDSPLWFLNTRQEEVAAASNVVVESFLDFETKQEVRSVFREFCNSGKLPSVVSYLTYTPGRECGLVNHQDVDSVFFSCLLMIQDSSRGRLHIPGVDLPERFESGDLIFMDPRVFHSVDFFARNEERKVVVFTV